MKQLLELAEEDYHSFYSSLIDLGDTDNSNEAHCLCPVHGDSKESLHINLSTGKWHCKTCGVGGHHVVQFYSFLYGCDKQDAIEELKAKMGLEPTPTENYLSYHKILLKKQEPLDYLKDRGITPKIISDYKIGWNGSRFFIPILDWGFNLRNIRKHLMGPSDTEEKTLSSFKGVGGIRLYPIHQLMGAKKIFIFEGELDTLLAISHGIRAVTITGGAQSWNVSLNKYFEDKEVFICYDVDEAGKKGARKVAFHLQEIAKSVKLINLPSEGLPSNGDFTDFVKKYGIAEFKKIKPTPFTGLDLREEDEVVQDIHLSESTKAVFYNKRVRTTAIVTGKGELFFAPKKLVLTCRPDGDLCNLCPNKKYKGKRVLNVRKDDARILKLFKVTEREQFSNLKQIVGIPKECSSFKLEKKEVQNLEEVMVIPEIDYNALNSTSYVNRNVYVISDEVIAANKPYILEGISLPHPKTQSATMILYKQTSTKDNIDSFEMSEELRKKLEVFQVSGVSNMKKKLKEKYKDYEAITGIVGRHKLFLAIDMIYHSVISFDFEFERIKRGHVNGLIFGDTRTGKSASVDALMAHFKAGEATGGENISFAGLVGGAHKVGSEGKWGITWKIVPLNDRRLVKIDEFHQMDNEDIGKLSEMMSTGIANIQKMADEKTMARARLLFVANEKNGRNLSEYRYGCQAVPAIMGNHNEDIARLDFAIAVASDDVSREDVRKSKLKERKVATYTSELCHNLVMWAWSRKPKDVVFSKEAAKLTLDLAEKEGATYHVSIPLVPPAEQYVKLARLSCAAAAMFFSTDQSGEKVIVKPDHVELAHFFLEQIYNHKAMSFDQFSSLQFKKDTIRYPKEITKLGITDSIRNLLLSLEKINISGIEQCFVVERDDARAILFTLLKSNCLESYGTNMYKKTAAFVKFLSSGKFSEGKAELLDDNSDF